MANHQLGHVGHISQISLCAVLREEGAYLIATLPVGFVGSQHTAQVARLVNDNLGGQALLLESLTSFAYQTGYLAVGSR